MKKKNTKKWKKTQKKIKQKQQKDFVYLEQNRCLFIFTLFSILKKSAKIVVIDIRFCPKIIDFV